MCTVNFKHIILNDGNELLYIKHLLASGQGSIERSEAEPNIILYGRNQLDVGRGQVQ